MEVLGERTAWNVKSETGQFRHTLRNMLFFGSFKTCTVSLAAHLRGPAKGQAGKGWAHEHLLRTQVLC